MGFTYLPPGAKYPLQPTITCSSCQRSLSDLEIHHAPAVPHAMHVHDKEPLLTVFAWTGNLLGKFWFLDIESGEKV